MRHASLTFDPAAAACDMPALLSTQRPRHATCQPHFRPSGRGMRHASVTFDPAASACDMPALLSTQRPRGVCGRRRIWPGTCRGRVSGQLPCLGRGRLRTPANLAGGVRDASQVWPGTCIRVPSCIRPASLPRQRPGRWGVCWASSRRPTRGERRRRGLRAARSAGC